MNIRLIITLVGLVGFLGCSGQLGMRRFAEHPQPKVQQEQGMVVKDDGTIVFVKDRLEVSLRVLEDDFLNRQFAGYSDLGAESTNPFTYGNWEPWGQDWTPQRFTVLLLKVKNYAFPKVFIDPEKIWISTQNNRTYQYLDTGLLDDYFSPYLQSYAGQNHSQFRTITDHLLRTVYTPVFVFSGQEVEGYVVFPVLHNDVENFTVHVDDVGLRFDYKSDPVESVDLSYHFDREVYKAVHPREAAK